MTHSTSPRSIVSRLLHWLGWTLISASLVVLGAWAWESWGTVVLGNRLSSDALEQVRGALADGESGVAVANPSDEAPDPGYLDPTFGDHVPVFTLDPPLPTTPTTSPPPPYVRGEIPPEGVAFGVLTIPDINLEVALIEGVSPAELKVGVGHMPRTPLPGELGNSVVSGHRTTWGQPFNKIDTLEFGSLIYVETAWGTHVYEVTDQFIVKADAVWVTGPIEGAWLTLTSCHPKGSARERIITRARLVESPNLPYVNHMWGVSWAEFDTSFPRF